MAITPNQQLPKKKKSKLWLLLLLLLLIIALLVFLYLFYFQPKPISNTNLNANQNQAILPVGPTGSLNNGDSGVITDLKAANGGETVNQDAQSSAILVATAFTERFGSFSNQSDYRNFEELDQFMTSAVKKWVADYLATLKKQHADFNVYYAVETKAISTIINSFDDAGGKAQILVKTQRQEFNNTTANPSVFYQDMLLNLVKVNGDWLVNGAYWQ